MKLLLLILCAISSNGELFDGRFDTLIDHFRPTDTRTVNFVSKFNSLVSQRLKTVSLKELQSEPRLLY